MKKRAMICLWIPAGLMCLLILLAAGLLGFLTLTDYRPPPLQELEIRGSNDTALPGKELVFLTWNIGYAGLGKEMDFFYEGGTRVRPSRELFEKYLNGIRDFLASRDSAGFLFLPETDTWSKRTYYTDETEVLSRALPKYHPVFAKNYSCRFVPQPVAEPMGRVESGILVLSAAKPYAATRHGFSVNFPWPQSLFFLKRCFIELRYHLEGGKDLVVVALHNSTFDKGGKLRKVELHELSAFMNREVSKGNYVIAGGDWNSNPIGFDKSSIVSGDLAKDIEPPIDPGLLPGFRFVFDPTAPTNRDVNGPYVKGKTLTTIIDFFVVSPNVRVRSVRTISNGFEFSDHQPVEMKVTLE
jgi:endonuclease/exonuclease/phosphatase family metal-dependent hydrolase